MSQKVWGTILGVIGVLLWFMPMREGKFFNIEFTQAGNQIGGIAYLIPLACFGYSVFSWKEQHVLRIISAAVTLAICLLFFVQEPWGAEWGLYGLLIVSIIGLAEAIKDNRKQDTTSAGENAR